MSTYTIDGFNFDLPLNTEQIKALAKFHREQLHNAVYHENEQIGSVGISQRAKIAALLTSLDSQSRSHFYDTYNNELKGLAGFDDTPADSHSHEKEMNPFILFVGLAIVAVVLYFAFVAHITPTT